MATTAYLGLGSNLGDRLTNLQRAVDLLAAQRNVTVVRSSRVYETDPVGPAQPDFLNAVIEVETSLPARGLLRSCQEVERALGRERSERWGPRTIDVDILTFDDERIDESDLVVPHPRIRERGFVLTPLLELDADPPLPGVRTGRLDPRSWSRVRPFAPPLEVPP